MKKSILLILILAIFSVPSFSQGRENPHPSGQADIFSFTPIIDLKATSVKDQYRTNTCWSFSTTSFIESELMRMGRGEYDLSEMYIIRKNYLDRLEDNFSKQGKDGIGEGGGLPHDWIRDFRESGIVPENVYPGLNYGSLLHNHQELHSFISAVASVALKENMESPQYHQIVNSILDIYLGKIPETFSYKGAEYTTVSFAKSLGLNPDDYIEVSSYTQFPFYSQGVLEVPDNWAKAKIYNVPLDELIQIMEYSLENGYTFAWDGDVSESGFSNSKGLATIPEETVTQEMRQQAFENSSTTDDHGMHVTGLVAARDGRKYFKVKNSWGTERNPYDGYVYMSEPYARAKTILILVNKNAVPPAVKSKLGL